VKDSEHRLMKQEKLISYDRLRVNQTKIICKLTIVLDLQSFRTYIKAKIAINDDEGTIILFIK